MTVPSKNDIVLQMIVQDVLTNKTTPAACVTRILNLQLDKQEKSAMIDRCEYLLRVKNITMADLFRRTYKEFCDREQLLS